MCLIRVKEEDDYSVPARVVHRERRRSPPRTTRVSRTYYEEPARSQDRTYVIQQPPPPPPVITYQVPHGHDHYHHSPAPPPPQPASSSHHTVPQFVEVSPATNSSSSSSSSSSSDGRRSKKTSHSKTTGPRSEYHMHEKEYLREHHHPHRSYEYPPNQERYDTYRYVEPGRSTSRHRSGNFEPRSSQYDDPHASRSSYNKKEQIVYSRTGARNDHY